MAKKYIIQGFYPDGRGCRVEVTANTLYDAIIVAQVALRVTTLRCTYVIDAGTEDKLAFFSDNLTIM